MRRTLLLALVAALLGAGLLAGCGDDDGGGGGGDNDPAAVKKEFDEKYESINNEIVTAGEELQRTLQGADKRTNDELATQFSALSSKVLSLKERLDDLEAPAEYSADRERLSKALQVAVADLGDISDAAEQGQGEQAKTKVQELLRHSVELRTARRGLARKTGAQT